MRWKYVCPLSLVSVLITTVAIMSSPIVSVSADSQERNLEEKIEASENVLLSDEDMKSIVGRYGGCNGDKPRWLVIGARQ